MVGGFHWSKSFSMRFHAGTPLTISPNAHSSLKKSLFSEFFKIKIILLVWIGWNLASDLKNGAESGSKLTIAKFNPRKIQLWSSEVTVTPQKLVALWAFSVISCRGMVLSGWSFQRNCLVIFSKCVGGQISQKILLFYAIVRFLCVQKKLQSGLFLVLFWT